jgi:hypothetical protein
MIRRVLFVVAAVAAFIVFATPTPSEAARGVLSAEARGVNQANVTKRAEKRLKRKINAWARVNRVNNAQVGRVTTGCSSTGSFVECKSVAFVRG